MRRTLVAAGACAALAAGGAAGVLAGAADGAATTKASGKGRCAPLARCVLRAGPWRARRATAAGLDVGRTPGHPAPLPGAPPAGTTSVPATSVAAVTPTVAPPPPVTTNPTAPPPTFMRTGVTLTEFALHLAHPLLAAGAVELNAINDGMDDHDMTVADGGGAVLGQTPVVKPGGESALQLQLGPGTYRVYCSLYGGAHDAAGMHATLTVG